MVTFGSDFRP